MANQHNVHDRCNSLVLEFRWPKRRHSGWFHVRSFFENKSPLMGGERAHRGSCILSPSFSWTFPKCLSESPLNQVLHSPPPLLPSPSPSTPLLSNYDTGTRKKPAQLQLHIETRPSSMCHFLCYVDYSSSLRLSCQRTILSSSSIPSGRGRD